MEHGETVLFLHCKVELVSPGIMFGCLVYILGQARLALSFEFKTACFTFNVTRQKGFGERGLGRVWQT